jgi:hypothetical protein
MQPHLMLAAADIADFIGLLCCCCCCNIGGTHAMLSHTAMEVSDELILFHAHCAARSCFCSDVATGLSKDAGSTGMVEGVCSTTSFCTCCSKHRWIIAS